MPAEKRRFPISLHTIGLVLLVLAAALAPLLRPALEGEKEPPREQRPRSSPTTTSPPEQRPRSTTQNRRPPAPPSLAYTQHARERFAERRISEEDALEVLTSPDTREHEKPGEDGGEVYKFTGRVLGRALVVVAEEKGRHFTVITGYWDDD